MLVMLLIGWIVLLPAVVVAGLYIGSSVLSRRRRAALHAYEDLLADEESFVSAPPGTTAELAPVTPLHVRGGRADPVPVVDEKPPVAARS